MTGYLVQNLTGAKGTLGLSSTRNAGAMALVLTPMIHYAYIYIILNIIDINNIIHTC